MAGRQKKKDAAILDVAAAVDNLVTQLGELDRFDAIRGTDDHKLLWAMATTCDATILQIARRHGSEGVAEKVHGMPEDEALGGDP